MYSIFATICKELLQLRRDKAGLVVLFVMPAALVLIISLIQDNILNTTGTVGVKALFINLDKSDLGNKIEKWMTEEGGFTLIKELRGKPISEEFARNSVKEGEYQFCVVIPAGLTETLRKHAAEQAKQSLSTGKKKTPIKAPELKIQLKLFFDPTVQGSFRTAVSRSLNQMIFALEIEEKADAFSKEFPRSMRHIIKTKILDEVGDIEGDEQEEMIGKIPEIQFNWSKDQVVGLDQQMLPAPTAVQQNVPAWTLFGMFFIVVPLGGSLLRERQEGTLTRLMAMPVSLISLLVGKILAYMAVCMVQFVLMLLVGIFVLPLFGTPVLELGHAPLAIGVIALASALAATGYGILIGSLVKSYEQASMFGSVSVVIAAAIGGIMVPVYVMPKIMKTISVYSPLAWGLNGFLDVFVREGTLVSIMPWVIRLLAFFAICLGGAWIAFRRKGVYR